MQVNKDYDPSAVPGEEDPVTAPEPDAGADDQDPQGQGPGGAAPKVQAAPLLPPGPPPDARDRMTRLIKRRADSLMRSRLDDRGRVLNPGIDNPDMAFFQAMQDLPKYMKGQGAAEQLRSYLEGGPLPKDWLPFAETEDGNVLPAKSRETMQAEMAAFRSQAQREALGPGWSAAMDYVIDPIGNIIPAFAQSFADVYAGLVGAKEQLDVKASIHAFLGDAVRASMDLPSEATPEQSFTERTKQLRAQIDANTKAGGGFAAGSQKTGEFAGTLLSYFWGGGAIKGAGMIGKAATLGRAGKFLALPHHIMAVGGKIGGRIGGAIGSKVGLPNIGAALGQSSGAFGALNAVTARGEGQDEEGLPASTAPNLMDRLKGLGIGALEGIPIAVGSLWAKHVFHGMFKTAYKALGKTEQEAMDALQAWAKKTGVKGRLAKETDQQYAERLSSAFVDAGMPGAPKMPVRKFMAYAKMGGIEALSFSSIDQELWKDLIEGANEGDGSKIAKSLATFLGNALLLGASKMPLNQLPPWQRARPDPNGELLREATTPLNDQGLRDSTIEPPQLPRGVAGEVIPQPGEMGGSAQQGVGGLPRQTIDPRTMKAVEPEGPEPAPEISFVNPPPAEPARVEGKGGLAGEQLTKLEGEVTQDVNPATLRVAEGEVSPATGTVLPEPAPLARFGWVDVFAKERATSEAAAKERAEGEKAEATMEGEGGPAKRYEVPDTELSYEVREGQAKPSLALSRLLGAPEGWQPAKEFERTVELAELASSMEAKTAPGTDISATPVIKAVAGDANQPGVMRKVQLGQKYEAELSPSPKWKPVDEWSVAPRAKDYIEPDQRLMVEALTEMMGSPELSPQSRMLGASILNVFDTVSWRNDPAVKEAMEAVPQLLSRLQQNPGSEQVDASIKALAEILTTKSKELALGDMVEGQVKEDLAATERFENEGGQPREPRQETDQQTQWEQRQADVATLRQQFGEDAIERWKPARWEKELRNLRLRRERPGESGAVDVVTPEQAERLRGAGKVAREAISNVVNELIGQPVRALGRGLAAVLDLPPARQFAVGLIEKVRQVESEIGARGFAAEANTRDYHRQYDPIVAEIPNTNIRELERTRWEEPTASGAQGGYSDAQVYKETDLQQKFNVDPSQAPAKVKQALGPWNRLTRLIREHASALGMHVQGRWTPEGELAEISPDAKKDVMTRQYTQLIRDALMRGKGKVYEAFLEVVGKANGMTPEQVKETFDREGWTDARGVTKRDPLERVRVFKFMPDQMKLADGSITKIMETNPHKHAKAMAKGAAMRLGTVKEFGPDDPLPDMTTSELISRLTGEKLPVAYLKVIEQAQPGNRESVAMMLRALMGMPTARLSPDVEIGGGYHKMTQVMSGLNDLAAALRMTYGSVLQNISEPFGTARALLGSARMDKAYGQTASEVAEGRLGNAITERQQAGGFELNLREWLVGGEGNKLDNFLQALRTGQNAALLPFDATQTVNDISIHRAIYRAVEGWREGTSEAGDAVALQTMFGFKPSEAQQIITGKAKPELYRQIELNGLSRITRHGDLPVNKSDFARSRKGLARAIKFTGFFQNQIARLRQAAINMREAETPEQQKAAFAGFAKMVGFNMAAYFVGQSIIKGFGGTDELMGYWGENLEDLSTPGGAARLAGTAIVGSLLGSVGSVVGGGISAALGLSNDKEKADVVDAIANMVPGVGNAIHMSEFTNASLHHLAGSAPPSDSPYNGKTPLQSIGHFIGSQVSAARWVENGPFGLGISFLTSDPQLEGALRASRRISSKLGADPEFGTNTDPEFTDAMRKAVGKLKGDEGPDEVADAIRQALPDEDDTRVARSLLARRALAGPAWDELSEEQQQSKLRSLGEKRVELLRGYDAVLERTARYFQRFGRRRRRRSQ